MLVDALICAAYGDFVIRAECSKTDVLHDYAEGTLLRASKTLSLISLWLICLTYRRNKNNKELYLLMPEPRPAASCQFLVMARTSPGLLLSLG